MAKSEAVYGWSVRFGPDWEPGAMAGIYAFDPLDKSNHPLKTKVFSTRSEARKGLRLKKRTDTSGYWSGATVVRVRIELTQV